MTNTTLIDKNCNPYAFRYAVCTIVNSWDEYAEMRTSFESAGFVDDTEYLVADNSKGNVYDAYQAIAGFFRQANSTFLIVVHQDVRLIDNREKLESCLNDLNLQHPEWAICGNAGAKGYHQHVTYISYPSHTEKHAHLPCKVNSLDENLLVIRRDSGLTISTDLKGFHLYGTDLCILAHIIGGSAWVISFMALHLSKGNLKSLEEAKGDFLKQYGKKLDIGYIQTTCTQFYLSNSTVKNNWSNSTFFFFLIKQLKRYPFLFRKWFGKS